MRKTMTWKRALGAALATAILLPVSRPVSRPALAQNGVAPRGGGMRGPGGPGRGMMRGPKMDLERAWRGIGRLQGSLSKDQARRIVALVRPWSSKPSMSDAQAKTLAAQLNSVLTAAQKSELAKRRQGGPGGPGGQGGWGGRGGGDGRDGGGRPGGRDGRGPGGPPPGGFDPQKMEAMRAKMEGLRKTMNPFYPPSKYAAVQSMPDFMRSGMTRRYDESRKTLEALAHKAA